jgi:hypothetical protein
VPVRPGLHRLKQPQHHDLATAHLQVRQQMQNI